jgi:hypothetical protein
MGAQTTPAQTPDAAQKARERAAARASPKIAEVLISGVRIRVAELVQLVAEDAVDTGMTELSETDAKKLGNPVVAHGLLVGYTPAKYGSGRWLGRSTARAVAKAFETARRA